MRPDGRDDGRDGRRLRVQEGSDEAAAERDSHEHRNDVVFDFTGLHRPDLANLSLIFTARLQAKPGDRVWIRALPRVTWRILHALGLSHLFRPYPGPDAILN